MRIMHVTDTSVYNYDGISTYINELLECAESKGDTLMVLTTVPHNPDKKRSLSHNAEVRVFPCYKRLSSAKFKFGIPAGMDKVINEFNPDILWIHTIGPLGLYAARKARNKHRIIYTKHCFDGDFWCSHLKISRPFRWFIKLCACIIENMVANPAEKIICHFKDDTSGSQQKCSSKFSHLPPPLSLRFFCPPCIKDSDKEYITLGFCGRCDPEKGLADIFRAIDLYQKQHASMPVKLLLIGDGKEAHLLKRKYPRVDVTITGFVDDVIPYLDQLDAFVLASHTETASLSSLEAYARGIPIVTRPVGYLGKDPARFHNVHIFETTEQLASLFGKLYSQKYRYREEASIALHSAIISFPQLYEMIVAKSI